MNRRTFLLTATVIASTLGAQAREPEDVERREAYFRSFLTFPYAQIPTASMRQMTQLSILRATQSQSVAMSLLGGGFVPLGPAGLLPQDGFWTSGQQLDAGRVSNIALHPSDPNTWYAATAGGGVWKTTNAGASWLPLTDAQCTQNTGAVALDPKNPQIVYVGTGELDTGSFGCGILKSIDAGFTWSTVLPDALRSVANFANSSGVIYVDSVTANTPNGVVLMGTNVGVFRSTDAGGSWTKVLPEFAAVRADNIVAHPANPNVLYTGLGVASNTTYTGLWRSDDKGATWTQMPFPPNTTATNVYRFALATSPAAPDKLWVFVVDRSTTRLRSIFVWDATTSQWTSLGTAGLYPVTSFRGDFGTQAWYDFVAAVDPQDANRIYVAGLRLFRSVDGGQTWTRIAAEIHVDWHALAIDRNDPRRIVGGNDGGVFFSSDGGDTWTSRNYGLMITQYYPGIALHPTDPGIVLGGSQDNGSHRSFGMPVWEGITGGDGGFTAINSQNPQIQWTTCQWQPGACIFRYNPQTGGWAGVGSGISSGDRALFIPPLVIDPVTPTTLYFGTHKLYRTTNEATWQVLGPLSDWTRGSSGAISTIAPALDSKTIYVGTNDGNIRVTRDAGVTWDPVGSGLAIVAYTDIAVDPADAKIAYAVSSSFNQPHVHKTTNSGANWSSISGNLPDIPVFSIAYIPSENVLIIGTQLGVYQSADGGTTWVPGPAGIPMVPVRDLAYNANTGILVAATHGRGMYVLRVGATTPVLRGDVNRDGVVNAADALLIQKALIGQSLGGDDSGPFLPLPRGDANCNGVVESVDALIVLRHAVGLSTGASCVNTQSLRRSY